jgi:SAM-dependent methyltransferase
MDHLEVSKYWEANAEAWTKLSRKGRDIYRDFLNTPAFMASLPDIAGLKGVDIGCGEGSNTRRLAECCAGLSAIDISPTFIRYAIESESKQPLGIQYQVASAIELPFENESFDFATSFMCMMDVPELDKAIAEAFRVLKPNGFFQFSITHPCFCPAYRRNLRNEHGLTFAIEVGDYFRNLDGETEEWIFKSTTLSERLEFRRFRIPRFTLTISQWFNLLIRQGFVIEYVDEPRPDDAVVAQCPALQDAQVVAYFLHVRVRKLASGVVYGVK